jgi:hypothetical protein
MTMEANVYQLDAMACAPSISAADYAAWLRAVAEKERADEWGDLDDRGRIRRACGWCGETTPDGSRCDGCCAAAKGGAA